MKEGNSWLWIVVTAVVLNVAVCGVQRQVGSGAVEGESWHVPAAVSEGESLHSRSRRESAEDKKGPSSVSAAVVAGPEGSDKKWPSDGSKTITGGADSKKNSSDNNSNAVSNQPSIVPGDGGKTKDVSTGKMVVPAKEPDKGVDPSKLKEITEPKDSDETENEEPETNLGNPTKFDEKAIQRALIVTLGLAVILIIYFGVKFAMLKKKKMDKRYGRIESEMDLLDEIEVDSEEEEDDTLFDVNTIRRSHL